MLNHSLFQKIQKSKKHILCVTKYWDTQVTLDILQQVQEDYLDIFFGLGENRVESLREKNFPREYMHFIGNIQSQKIPEITKYCCCIHSLASLKHAQKIENQGLPIQAFIQIKLDDEKNIGISEPELPVFLKACKDFKHLKIIGISGMGNLSFSEFEKRSEFQKLVSLHDEYVPHGIISAGTSRDYDIALEEGIDVVRVGSKILSSEI